MIFSKTTEEHIKRQQQAFQRFREAKLKNNRTKCDFSPRKVQYFGPVISKDGLKADPEKIETVQKIPIPQNQTIIRSFLGLHSNYRQYIENFAFLAQIFHKSSETENSVAWTGETQEAFESFKKPLSSTPVLDFPNIKEPLILYTDANLTAMGAISAQIQDGKARAICYASKSFTKSKTNYSATK